MPWLEFSDLKVMFNNKTISFGKLEIDDNYVLIHGKSGSGKTTLLHTILGVIPNVRSVKVSGRIKLMDISSENGHSIDSFKKVARRSFLVLQEVDHNLFAKNVKDEFMLDFERVPMEILRLMGIDNLLERDINELSYGEKQKVAIAIALSHGADVIFMDEPLAHLDVKSRSNFKRILRKLLALEKRIVISEHRTHYFMDAQMKVKVTNQGVRVEEPQDMNIWSKAFDHVEKRNTVEKCVLRTKDLEVSLGTFFIHDVNLEVYEGEIVGLIGANGSGKTTLAKALSGIIDYSGDILLDGVKVRRKDLWGKVAYMHQNPDIQLFETSVLREISLGAKEDVRQYIEVLGLEKYLHMDPHTLSRGERLRVVVASILSASPKVVILDEPTSGQDPESTLRIVDAILRFKRSVIIISHELELIKGICDRVYLIKEGTIHEIDPKNVSENVI